MKVNVFTAGCKYMLSNKILLPKQACLALIFKDMKKRHTYFSFNPAKIQNLPIFIQLPNMDDKNSFLNKEKENTS